MKLREQNYWGDMFRILIEIIERKKNPFDFLKQNKTN